MELSNEPPNSRTSEIEGISLYSLMPGFLLPLQKWRGQCKLADLAYHNAEGLRFWDFVFKISEERLACVMAEKKEYFVRVQGALVSVSSEVYQACHQTKRYTKTLYEKDQRNGLVSYDSMDTDDVLGEEMIPDQVSEGVEDQAVSRIMKEKLHECITLLSEEEQALIRTLFFEESTERELAQALGISQKAVNKRKKKAIEKLRRLMKT